ncbi:Gp49 family protein [Serratia sp. BW106]|uniref:Gp49 family protein n=1 Tax=Serratia sp. BW106 TaxID=1884636 RepID=UPI000BFF932A
MTEIEIEQEILRKGLTAPRITPEHIERLQKVGQYHRFPGTTVIICCITLENGYTVTGESACASPENFDEEIGRKIALQNAVNKIWGLEGYLLRQKLHENTPLTAGSNESCGSANVSNKTSGDVVGAGLVFGEAIKALQSGKKVARAGWNGKGLWLELQVPDTNSKMTLPYIFMSYPGDAKTTPGARVPWLASQTDMLADDWLAIQ